MDINKLNDAWITAGQKVSDLDNKLAMLFGVYMMSMFA